ncbi:LOW QUALITY PROTEIN: transcription repressor OFP6-like, partial [Brachypodium distachyon]|uniref:LOW QUALITY PROTEIN: transcription repressor OFP6-like n=1 Tax=Brachypodium distachyon TaxID=15368 RepID=UPI000D0DE58E
CNRAPRVLNSLLCSLASRARGRGGSKPKSSHVASSPPPTMTGVTTVSSVDSQPTPPPPTPSTRESLAMAVAVEVDSAAPYDEDFRESMVAMVVEKEMYSREDLNALLHGFLQLNSPRHHPLILHAFANLWAPRGGPFCPPFPSESASPLITDCARRRAPHSYTPCVMRPPEKEKV